MSNAKQYLKYKAIEADKAVGTQSTRDLYEAQVNLRSDANRNCLRK
jgi:hypothetical protein